MLIYDYCDNWLKRKRGEIRESTLINYDYAIKRFKRYFDNCEIQELKREDVNTVFAEMAYQGCSYSAIYNVRQVLQAVYSEAIEFQYTLINPFKKVRISEEATCKTVEAYTISQEKKIIEVAQDDILGDIYIFLLLTGLRKSELINLKKSDYNPKLHTITIRKSKTEYGVRTIAISAKAELIILRQPKTKHKYLFSNSKGNPISTSSLKKLYLRLEKKVGFDMTNHKCRHTFCTRLVEANVDPKTICTLSGHKSVSFMMQRYVTSDLTQQREALKLLDGVT